MKTKLILSTNALWLILAILNEKEILDLIPDDQWLLKIAIVFALALVNAFVVKPDEAKKVLMKTINPTPKPPKPPKL